MRKNILKQRKTISSILNGEDTRLLVLVGPCSLHSIEGALLYAEKLQALQEEVKETLFIVMRAYIEKSRTSIGWKGFLYDPYLRGTEMLTEGFFLSKKLLSLLTEKGLPLGMEFVNPALSLQFADFFSWGCIGARTVSSQPHRELASFLPFPVGFKNSIDGNSKTALESICVAKTPQQFFGVTKKGILSSLFSKGNQESHLILRGSSLAPNYDHESIQKVLYLQEELSLSCPILIDCAHDNSKKSVERQKEVFISCMHELPLHKKTVRGFMLESFLDEGKQPFSNGKCTMTLSITDPCIGFEETSLLLRWAHKKLISQSQPTLAASNYQ